MSSVKIKIPAVLKPFTGKKAELFFNLDEIADDLEVRTSVLKLLQQLTSTYMGLDEYIFSEPKKLNNFLNVYLNGEDIRFLEQGLDTALKDRDVITLLLATAGG